MSEKDGLLPCPFCGSPDQYAVEGDGNWYIACSNAECFCVLGEAYDPSAMPVHIFRSERDAKAAWNVRSTPPAITEEAATIRDECIFGLGEIEGIIAHWLKYDREDRAREGLETTPDTHLMSPPTWPSHGQLEHWISAIQKSRAALTTMGRGT